MKNLFMFFVIVVIGGGLVYYVRGKSAAGPTTILRTAPIHRGELLATVDATGTLQPEEVVNVGAQVAGLIVSFGKDPDSPSGHVDYCSVVEEGTVLAEIDPTFYKAALEQAEATLQSAKANLLQYRALLKKATNLWKRTEELFILKTVSESEYDTALAEYETSDANIEAGKAAIRLEEARVRTAEINLGYCTITSPVRGTIIERRVNIGQTVVASLNAPSLFLIAKDLTKMQVWTSVNEADIGRIRLGMPVRFTVDAHDEEDFTGTVTQIRMNAQMTMNVVTYTVVVTTDNAGGKLLPYLTANVRFEIERKPDVLLVPNAALRWTPDATQLDPSVPRTVLDEGPDKANGMGRVWIEGPGGYVKPLDVNVGATDGTVTEISGTGLTEGLAAVIGEDETATLEQNTSNPFLPKFPDRKKKKDK